MKKDADHGRSYESVRKANDFGSYKGNDDDEGDMLALGERFHIGNLDSKDTSIDFISGGGGMVFSLQAVRAMVRTKATACQCPIGLSTYPDDILIGICLAELGIPIIHSERFHQVRS